MRSLLITGGTGYFGRAFARFALEHGVHRVCVYSRGEYAQAQMRGDMGNPEELRWMIGDVRDHERLTRAMRGCEWVVHAAALKRIEVGHYNPTELIKTNVLGTMNVAQAAGAPDDTSFPRPRKVVGLSTDKAWQPVSAYGYSKAMAETVLLGANREYAMPGHYLTGRGPIFAVTRYGNVAGSTGSVIPTWRAMQANGACSVPVTDPDCTRFWMTRQQACQLVWDTLTYMEGGELNIPILPAFRLGDLAEAMGLDYHVTGLGAHEKKHEGMDDGNTSDTAPRLTKNEISRLMEEDGL